MGTNLTSITSGSTSLAQFLAQEKSNSANTLLSSFSNSSAMSSLLSTVMSGATDILELSGVASGVGEVAKAAARSDVSEGVKGVQKFVASLQKDGVSSLTIMRYLNIAKELAKNDPERFKEIFTGNVDSSAATDLTADESEDADATDSASESADSDTESNAE